MRMGILLFLFSNAYAEVGEVAKVGKECHKNADCGGNLCCGTFELGEICLDSTCDANKRKPAGPEDREF